VVTRSKPGNHASCGALSEKPCGMVDPQVSLSSLVLKNAIAEYFVSSKLLHLVKQMYNQNL